MKSNETSNNEDKIDDFTYAFKSSYFVGLPHKRVEDLFFASARFKYAAIHTLTLGFARKVGLIHVSSPVQIPANNSNSNQFPLCGDSWDRLHRSFSLFEENHSHVDTQIFNQLVADSCLKSISSSDASSGLLTVCIGSDMYGQDGILSSSGLAADSLFFKMPDDFLFVAKNDLIVDLHEDIRNRDRRIKASCWPLERTNIEKTRPTNVIETLLYKAPNNAIVDTLSSTEIINDVNVVSGVGDELPNILQLTEGLTSNFFACKNDCLITAPDGHSLSGSMSRIVIAAAKALGITVLREFPVLEPSKSDSWSSAFLTSAARPMHGIQTVLGPKGEMMFESSAECKTVTSIRKLLEAVLRNQDNNSLCSYIPYSLWSASVTSETTSSQIRKMFDTHSQYL